MQTETKNNLDNIFPVLLKAAHITPSNVSFLTHVRLKKTQLELCVLHRGDFVGINGLQIRLLLVGPLVELRIDVLVHADPKAHLLLQQLTPIFKKSVLQIAVCHTEDYPQAQAASASRGPRAS